MSSISSLVLATRNAHKIAELTAFLGTLPITVRSLTDFSHVSAVEEDGMSFMENALKKARHVHRLTGIPALADDSGLEVFYLNGRPGIHSARYAGHHATDADNNRKLLLEMKGVSPRRRNARFVAQLALVGPGYEEMTRGTCPGTLGESPVGRNGFGYDPLFIPLGSDRTYAELTAEEKNRISHRSMAFAGMKKIIDQYTR